MAQLIGNASKKIAAEFKPNLMVAIGELCAHTLSTRLSLIYALQVAGESDKLDVDRTDSHFDALSGFFPARVMVRLHCCCCYLQSARLLIHALSCYEISVHS